MGFTASNILSSLVLNQQGVYISTGFVEAPLASLLGMSRLEAGEESPFAEVGSTTFLMSQAFSLDAASQPDVSENDQLTAPTSGYNNPAQVPGYVQNFDLGMTITDTALAEKLISGTAVVGDPYVNSLMKQAAAKILQIKKNYDYSCLHGTARAKSDDGATSSQMGGLFNAISSNKINASGAELSKELLEDELISSMADNGSGVNNPVIMTTAKLFIKLGRLYTVQPSSYVMGGVDIQELMLPTLGKVKMIFNPNVASGYLGLFNAGNLQGVANTSTGYAQLSIRKLTIAGIGESWGIYLRAGLDYMHESKHGMIYGITE